jgi:MFS family permease
MPANQSNTNFRLMAGGQIVTVLGSSLLRFALSLHVLDTTGRVDIFAALVAVSGIPNLLAPLGGAVSDRLDRRLLMVFYDAFCCAVTFVFLFVLLSGHASIFAVGTVMALLGFIGAMETPNGAACVPLLVPTSKLESANGIIQGAQSLSGIAAPALGGVLYGVFGIRALVAISGTAFGLAAVMETFIHIPFERRPRSNGILRTLGMDLKDGFHYVWQEIFIRRMMIVAALLNLSLAPCFIVAGPLVLRMTMKSPDALYGIGMGAVEAASVVGALTVGVFSKKMSITGIWQWIFVIALLFIPLAFVVTPAASGAGFWPPYIGFCLFMVIIAAATTILSIFVIVRIQAKTPNENLGKVMAIIQSVAQCAAPIGQLLYGAAFEGFPGAAYLPLLMGGGLTLIAAFIAKAMLNEKEIIHEQQ